LDAVHSRQIDVEKNDIGLQFPDFLDGLLAVSGFAANPERVPMEK
jgi:hypothetical protein